MLYFIYFIIYGFVGFLLETIYAFYSRGIFVLRKCYLFNPLCPVYGLGAIAIVLATKYFKTNKLITILIGTITATIVEYFVHYIYKDLLGVSIWDYSDLSYNINGRVCLKFSLYWSILTVFLVYYIHPFIEKNIPSIPRALNICMLVFIGIDSILSIILYKKFGSSQAVNISWLISNFHNSV